MGRLAIRRVEYFRDRYTFSSPELPDGLVVVEGANGSGKTTFVDLIYFALGGAVKKFARKGSDLHKEIREDSNNGVRLTVEINGGVHYVTRRFEAPEDIGGAYRISRNPADDMAKTPGVLYRQSPEFGFLVPLLRDHPRGGCILVVEDDLDLRASIRDALQEEGYRVIEANNGREALHILVRHDPEVTLIVSDILMPEMSGSDLVRVLANYVRLSRIPVILITAALPAPAADYGSAVVGRLQKPFGLPLLLDLVGTTLSRQCP